MFAATHYNQSDITDLLMDEHGKALRFNTKAEASKALRAYYEKNPEHLAALQAEETKHAVEFNQEIPVLAENLKGNPETLFEDDQIFLAYFTGECTKGEWIAAHPYEAKFGLTASDLRFHKRKRQTSVEVDAWLPDLRHMPRPS